jgi:hypothetical protein
MSRYLKTADQVCTEGKPTVTADFELDTEYHDHYSSAVRAPPPPRTHWIGHWVGLRCSLDIVRNMLPLTGIEPRASRP